jgi:TonB family protein
MAGRLWYIQGVNRWGTCMRTIGLVRSLLLALAMSLLAAPAMADIKSFNAAIQKGDFKGAAAAAASAWPGLDKSRQDLAVIAREFAFAAYMSGDFAAAKAYGDAALATSIAVNEAPILKIGSELTLRLAEYRIAPGQATRDALNTVLQARVADPTIDLIAYMAADAVAVFDFDKGYWRAAMASGAVGEKLTASRGPAYDAPHFRFALLSTAARYMAERNMAAYDEFGAVQKRIVSTIGAAPAGRNLTDLEEVYREASAWSISAYSHLKLLRRLRDEKKRDAEWEAYSGTPEYRAAIARISTQLPEGTCVVRISDKSPDPRYPSSALFNGMIGTIILKMDVDAEGKAHNARLVAAVPAKHFADTALKNAAKMTFQPVDGSPAGCTMTQKDKVITYQFTMRG